MLFRAICYSTDDAAPSVEEIAYVNAASRTEAPAILAAILSQLWGVPRSSVAFYNLSDETELLDAAIGATETGNARLLEVGAFGGRPLYPHRAPLFLLAPRDNARLLEAWRCLPYPEPSEPAVEPQTRSGRCRRGWRCGAVRRAL